MMNATRYECDCSDMHASRSYVNGGAEQMIGVFDFDGKSL
jgi:hypothetical protein